MRQVFLERKMQMYRTEQEWIQVYKDKGALAIHGGNPKAPHFLLTTDQNHSNGFFNSKPLISNREQLFEAACDLVELFASSGGDLNLVECVVGPQTGATLLAEYIAERISKITKKEVKFASPKKSKENGQKKMKFSMFDEFLRVEKNSVLLCDDVLSTGGSVALANDEVVRCRGRSLPFVLSLVNRSGYDSADNRKIVALINHPMPIWTPAECPLCAIGSKALRPKENWAALTAVY